MEKFSFELPHELTEKYFDELLRMNQAALNELKHQTDSKKRYLSKKETCEYLNISFQTLQSMIKSGLKTVEFGSKNFIDINDIHLFMNQQKK